MAGALCALAGQDFRLLLPSSSGGTEAWGGTALLGLMARSRHTFFSYSVTP